MADKPEAEKNISYVLLAEFDIDKGSTVKHQYPRACPVSENVLADLMLPEGAHLRESDWTIFFLRESDAKSDGKDRRMTKQDKWTANRKKLIKEINSLNVTVQVLEFSESVNDWFIMHEVAKLSFEYSGKWTVSTAIPKIEIKLNEMDDEQNTINSTEIDEDMQFTLLSAEDLFCSFYPSNGNAVGLKFFEVGDMKRIQNLIQQILAPEPKPSPEQVRKSELEHKKAREAAEQVAQQQDKLTKQLSVLNLVRTQKDDSVRRGAVVKALAVCTHLQCLDSFKPLLTLALDNYFRNESLEGLKHLYDTLNSVSFVLDASKPSPPLSKQYSFYQMSVGYDHVPIGSPRSPRAANNVNNGNNNNSSRPGSGTTTPTMDPTGSGARSLSESSNSNPNNSSMRGVEVFSVPIKLNSINMHLTVPKKVGVDEITGVSLKAFFEKFKRNIAIIYNAVFTEKRIIFLGHNEPSAKVCNMALAACLLTSPAIEGSLERCYPYACLTAMQFLQVAGYIAGVTNPIFEQRQEWYDLLCNVTTGEIKLSDRYREQLDAEQANYGKVIQCDKQFTLEIKNGMSMKYGEMWLRSSFEDYSDHIVKMALGNEVFETKEAEMNEFNINEWRINEWKKSSSYLKMSALYEERELKSPFGKDTKQLNKMVRTLQIRSLTEDEGIEYFVMFNKLLDSEEKVEHFVSLLKPSLGGLLPIVSYMCHSNLDIQSLVVDIVTKLEQFKIGKRMTSALNFFFVCNYHRLKLERVTGMMQNKREKQKSMAIVRKEKQEKEEKEKKMRGGRRNTRGSVSGVGNSNNNGNGNSNNGRMHKGSVELSYGNENSVSESNGDSTLKKMSVGSPVSLTSPKFSM